MLLEVFIIGEKMNINFLQLFKSKNATDAISKVAEETRKTNAVWGGVRKFKISGKFGYKIILVICLTILAIIAIVYGQIDIAKDVIQGLTN